ncbi:MAG: SpaA isopeptide-forming pilin-related protein, partial [Ruthenibacterium lactatiformans]
MIKDIFRRVTAGALSVLTLFTTVPFSCGDGGSYRCREDNEASSIEINVGEVYTIADRGVQKAWFQQNGAPRNVWPMFTEASDGTEIRAYCADHSKGNPGMGGMPYTVTSRISDMHVYGVAVRSDSRMSLNEFISTVGSPLTNENFTADMYFSASQAAMWAALGDAQIAANSSYGVNYVSSTSLGYRASGKTLSASSTSEALTLYAAIEMLKYGNEFYGVWGPNGKGHAPWVGATINYTPGNTEYAPAAQKTGSVDLPQGIVNSGVFAEKEIDGQDYMVLPMAAASATFVRGNQIFVRADNVPSGAFLMDSQGNKSYDESGAQRLTLKNVQKNNDLYKNGNDTAYGETFLFCIPKSTAEEMDAGSESLQTSFTVSMNADRYNVYAASTTSSGVQPVIMVEPAVQKLSANMAFSSIPLPTDDKVKLKVLKTDENGTPLEGCTFQITYEDNGQKTAEKTTDGNGEAIFEQLPLDTDVTVKETAAPEGYQLLPSKVINTGSKGGTVEYTFANSDDHVFKVHKTSSADGRNLMGAKFEVKGIDNDFVNTYVTDALGEFTIQGRDLPTGSFEVYEIAAPEGYATDGADIQTFSWDNTRDITLSFQNAPLPGIEIYKYDKDSKEPLAGATFEIRRDGQVLQTVKTDVNGYAKVYNLPKGFYQVVEVEPPQGYLKDEVEHEVYIDPSTDPTQIVREVNVPNTKKLSIRIIKQDKDTRIPLQGWKFDVYYNDAKLTSVTTGQDGEAMIENLQPGTYRVVEVDGDKEHYNLDAPEQTIELARDQAEIPTLIFQNTIKKHFGIYKIDEETREPIQGVTFEIWKDGRLLGNYTTDEHGRIWLPYAEPGTYQAKEIVTDPRYVLNETTFTIENNSEYPTFFTIPNTRKKDIIVKKIDLDTGKPMQGVVFEGFKDGRSIGMFTTGPDGTFTIDYADPGTYKFVERHTLAGYELSTQVLEGEHTTDRDLVLTLDNVEQKSFIVKKIDSETKEPLAGVQFKIWRDGILLGDYTTDENGRIEIKNAPAGT